MLNVHYLGFIIELTENICKLTLMNSAINSTEDTLAKTFLTDFSLSLSMDTGKITDKHFKI